MEKLKAAIIGAGQVADTAHIPNYLRHKDKVEVVAVSDINIKNAGTLANKYDIPHFYDNHIEMLEKEKIDIVSVCVTNKYHHDITIDALNAGCNVLCEKPPALNYEDAMDMHETARKLNKKLAYNFHYRHAPEVKFIKKMIDDGEFGKIYSVKATALRRRGIPGWGTFTNKELQGGGAMIDLGIHMLDTALYLLGFPKPTLIAAKTSDLIGKRPGVGFMGSWDPEKFTVEDGMFGFVKLDDGSAITIETSFALNMKEVRKMNVEIFGEFAGASVFDGEIYTEKNGALVDMKLPLLKEVDRYYESIHNFIESCILNEEPLCNSYQGAMLQKIIGEMYKSAAER
jgi:Predicted dehydrogenases and related proteins